MPDALTQTRLVLAGGDMRTAGVHTGGHTTGGLEGREKKDLRDSSDSNTDQMSPRVTL